jgi:ATP-dependent exoDNAse (exonuclease V) beta subunit
MEKAEACPERSRRNTECTEIKKDNSSEFSVLSVAKSDETIVVQGIIDMLIQTARGLVVIDFKTDNVTAKQAVQRAELYRRQLELYSRAAEVILKCETIARWLYFLSPATEFEVKS